MRGDDAQDQDLADTLAGTAETALSEITPELAAAYLDMVNEFEAAGEGYGWNDIELARRDFAAFVNDLRNEALGIGLPPDIVPQTTYVLIDREGRALGEIRFRPRLTPPFEQHNGHIGYNVRPSQRSKGYATRMLALVIEKARALGLERVMLPVRDDNLASKRVIEKNGGVMERTGVELDSGEIVSLYWITL
ncbi:MAG TPA: GNAT family N-acetyltransferase [Ktedonobacterales bacterium]|jgi:predicted acetyltransferase